MFSYSGQNIPKINVKPNKKKKYGEKMNIKPQDGLKWKATVFGHWHEPNCDVMLAEEDEKAIQTECNCSGKKEVFTNTVLNLGIYSIIEKLVDINNENTSDGFISYLEIGMSDTAPLASQTGLIKPKARKKIVSGSRDATNAVFKVFFNGTQANSSFSSITIGTSTTQFSLVGGSGSLFTIGELIEVDLAGGAEIVEITNLAGDVVTVDPPLSVTPSGGEAVKQAYKELGLFGGSSATTAIGTGTPFARTTDFTARTKDQGFGLTIEWHISIT